MVLLVWSTQQQIIPISSNFTITGSCKPALDRNWGYSQEKLGWREPQTREAFERCTGVAVEGSRPGSAPQSRAGSGKGGPCKASSSVCGINTFFHGDAAKKLKLGWLLSCYYHVIPCQAMSGDISGSFMGLPWPQCTS